MKEQKVTSQKTRKERGFMVSSGQEKMAATEITKTTDVEERKEGSVG